MAVGFDAPGGEGGNDPAGPAGQLAGTRPADAATKPALPRLEPAEWMDASWLGRPATPMVLSGASVFMGRTGWGLVCLGEAK
jgi:hypothetical protein